MIRKWIKGLAIWSLIAITGMTLTAADSELLKQVPAGIDNLVFVNMERIRALKLLEVGFSTGILGKLAELETNYHLKLDDCQALLLLSGGEELSGVIASTSLSEETLVEQLRKVGGNRYSAEPRGGKTIHFVTSSQPSQKNTPVRIGICFLKPGIILATEEVNLERMLTGTGTGSWQRSVASGSTVEPPIWGIMNVRMLIAGKSRRATMLQMFFHDLNRVDWTLDVPKGETDAMLLSGIGTCTDAQGATTLNDSLPSCLTLLVNMLLSSNPDLAETAVQTIKSRVNGNQIQGELILTSKMLVELINSLQQGLIRRVPATGSSPVPVPNNWSN